MLLHILDPPRRFRRRTAPVRANLAALLALVLWWPATSAQALEIYSLLNRDCGTHTGLIVNADAERVFLLTLAGELAVVGRSEVHRVLVFNTLDNPITRLDFRGGLGALTREVRLTGADSYLGWPIRFQEDAIIFFDTDGKTRVEDVDRVELVRKANDLPAGKSLAEAVTRTFLPGPNLAECPDSRSGEGPPIYPTRIISDRIKISRFLAAYDSGFAELERFRRRSTFYARPFLYEEQTKVALSLSGLLGGFTDAVFGNGIDFVSPELPALFPLYFQWSSGSPYGSQGLVVLGSKPVEWLPNVEPLLTIRSEVKSSFFSATFVGNPAALSVGKNFIVENRFAYAEFFSLFGGDEMLVIPQLNHLAMTGFDWGAYSVAVGYYYPVVGILADDVFRELVSPRPSIAYRVLRTTETTRFRTTHAHTRLSAHNPTLDDIRIVVAEDMREPSTISPASRAIQDALLEFSLDAQFIRVGLDVELRNELEVGIDQVRFWGDYREVFPGLDYRLEFNHHITSLHAFQRFGDYVALRGYLNYFERYYERAANGNRRGPHARNLSLTVAIEFIL